MKKNKKEKNEGAPPPPPPSSTPVIREGFLRVNRNPADTKKEWKLSYVVLRRGYIAYYEKVKPHDEATANKPKGASFLKGAIVGQTTSKEHAFLIQVAGQSFMFQAESADERRGWIEDLKVAIDNEAVAAASISPRTTAPTVARTPSDLPPVVLTAKAPVLAIVATTAKLPVLRTSVKDPQTVDKMNTIVQTSPREVSDEEKVAVSSLANTLSRVLDLADRMHTTASSFGSGPFESEAKQQQQPLASVKAVEKELELIEATLMRLDDQLTRLLGVPRTQGLSSPREKKKEKGWKSTRPTVQGKELLSRETIAHTGTANSSAAITSANHSGSLDSTKRVTVTPINSLLAELAVMHKNEVLEENVSPRPPTTNFATAAPRESTADKIDDIIASMLSGEARLTAGTNSVSHSLNNLTTSNNPNTNMNHMSNSTSSAAAKPVPPSSPRSNQGVEKEKPNAAPLASTTSQSNPGGHLSELDELDALLAANGIRPKSPRAEPEKETTPPAALSPPYALAVAKAPVTKTQLYPKPSPMLSSPSLPSVSISEPPAQFQNKQPSLSSLNLPVLPPPTEEPPERPKSSALTALLEAAAKVETSIQKESDPSPSSSPSASASPALSKTPSITSIPRATPNYSTSTTISPSTSPQKVSSLSDLTEHQGNVAPLKPQPAAGKTSTGGLARRTAPSTGAISPVPKMKPNNTSPMRPISPSPATRALPVVPRPVLKDDLFAALEEEEANK